MTNGPLEFPLGRYLRLLPLFVAILLFSSTGSAANLCVDGDTLAAYIGVGSCYVDAGAGVQVLFSFTPDVLLFNYSTDSPSDPDATGLTTADIKVYGVTGPGVPQAGLRFETNSFSVPADATYADLSLTFGVSRFFVPVGPDYLFTSAHLAFTGTPGGAANAFVAAGESDTLNSVFNLNLTNPPGPGDTSDAVYSPQVALAPNIDLFLLGPGSRVTNWVESFDMGDSNSNVPEPGTLALIPGAVVLFGLLRNKRYAKSILPVLALLTVLAAKSHATAVCTDLTAINGGPTSATSLTIDKYVTYTTNFGGCTMNDMLFKITSFNTTGTGATLPTAATTKLIFSLTNFANGTNDVQLNYLPVPPAATSAPTDSLTVTFVYSVTAPTYRITKMIGSSTVTGATLPTRTTTIVPNTSPAATGSPYVGLSPSITFNNPLNTTFTVTDKFTLSGANKHLSAATDKFTEVVPEPATSFLLSGALLGLGLISRRRRA